MKTVNVHEAKTKFSSLLAAVEGAGGSFVICRNGEPVADLVPPKRASRIKIHPALSRIKIKYNPIEPASLEEWPKRLDTCALLWLAAGDKKVEPFRLW